MFHIVEINAKKKFYIEMINKTNFNLNACCCCSCPVEMRHGRFGGPDEEAMVVIGEGSGCWIFRWAGMGGGNFGTVEEDFGIPPIVGFV